MTVDSAAQLYALLDESAAGASQVVDAGCGRGVHLRGTRGAEVLTRLKADGAQVIGIDVAKPDDENPYITEFSLIDDSGHWPVADASTDVVFSDWVLEHVTDPERFFGECGRVLRPGGVLVARTLQKWSVAGIGATVVPHRFHNMIISRLQPGMKMEDVFPTALRCNTRRDLEALCRNAGMTLEYTTHFGLAGYGAGNKALTRILDGLERAFPSFMRHTIVIKAVRQ